MKLQTVFLEPLVQHRENAVSIFLTLEEQDSIIGVPNQCPLPMQARLHGLLEPRVENLVKVEIREQGRDDTALR
jgi:hypothetical protein